MAHNRAGLGGADHGSYEGQATKVHAWSEQAQQLVGGERHEGCKRGIVDRAGVEPPGRVPVGQPGPHEAQEGAREPHGFVASCTSLCILIPSIAS